MDDAFLGRAPRRQPYGAKMKSAAGRPDSAPVPTDDAAWVASLRMGESDAIERLHRLVARRLSLAFGGSENVTAADLEDFAQDACVRILDTLGTFRGDARFATWATTVAVRVAMTTLRRRRWSRERVATQLDQFATPCGSGLSVRLETQELFQELRRSIAHRLTPRQRQVMLGELAGIPQVMIAEHLGATPGAIYKMSHDARRRLKRALEEAGFDSDVVRSILDRASLEKR